MRARIALTSALIGRCLSCARDFDARRSFRLPRTSIAIGVVAMAPAIAATSVALLVEGCGPRHARPINAPQARYDGSPALAPTVVGTADITTAMPPTTRNVALDGPAIEVKLSAYGLAEEHPCGGGRSLVHLTRCDGSVIADVLPSFVSSARMQGSGRLCDGRVVTIRKVSPLCFGELAATMPFGATASGRPAVPFRSIAIDPRTLAMGHWYYVAALDGLAVPASSAWPAFVHDGCVRADDTGGAVVGAHVDWFVGPLSYGGVELMRTRVGAHATIALADARCAQR